MHCSETVAHVSVRAGAGTLEPLTRPISTDTHCDTGDPHPGREQQARETGRVGDVGGVDDQAGAACFFVKDLVLGFRVLEPM